MVSTWSLQTISPVDPNEKDGPTGEDSVQVLSIHPSVKDGGRMTPDPLKGISYSIQFENLPTAQAAAQSVTIVDQLDTTVFDPKSVTFHAAQVGTKAEQRLSFDSPPATLSSANTLDGGRSPANSYQFEGSLQVKQTLAAGETVLDSKIKATADPVSGRIEWKFETQNAGPRDGLLLPNDASGQGVGSVSFSVKPKDGLDEGQEVKNEASVQFDELSTLTATWMNHVSYFPLRAPAYPVPESGGVSKVPVNVTLQWEPVSRAVSYALRLWRSGLQAQCAEMVLEAKDLSPSGYNVRGLLSYDSSYCWQVAARDDRGGSAQGDLWAFTTVVQPPDCPGEPNNPDPADGSRDISVRPVLSWEPQAGAEVYEIYLWPSSEEERPSRPIASILGENHYDYMLPGDLERDTEYSWQVKARNAGCGEPDRGTFGPVWKLVTLATPFRRGDANASGRIDLSDAVFILNFLFSGGSEPRCTRSADVNGSNVLDITDPIFLLSFLFLGGPSPPEPHESCGVDPDGDKLGCRSFSHCP